MLQCMKNMHIDARNNLSLIREQVTIHPDYNTEILIYIYILLQLDRLLPTKERLLCPTLSGW